MSRGQGIVNAFTDNTCMITITPNAEEKIRTLIERENPGLHLRVAVQPGGCSGLRYQLYFDDRNLDGDREQDYDGFTVATDHMSAPYLDGAVIDYVDSIDKQGFTIDNPNAVGTCACGDSFH